MMISRFMRGVVALSLIAALGCGDRSSKPATAAKGAADEHGKDEHGEGGHAEGEHGDEAPKGGHGDEHGEGGHEEEESGMVRLTAAQIAAAKLEIAVAETRSVAGELGSNGEVVAPDDGVARVGAKVAGRVTRFTAGVGDHVKRGQVLASLDSPELGRAKADYIAAVAAMTVTRQTADREEQLFQRKISSERDWRDAEAAAVRARADKEAAEVRLHTLGVSDAQLKRVNASDHLASAIGIAAPIEGVVVEREASLGQMLEPGDPMFVLMDLRTVWILADIYERDLAQLAIGHGVEARVAAWPERTFAGKVTSIGAVVDRRSRTVKVRVVLPNADGALKPGMFASVTVSGAVGDARDGLFVPAAAVQRDGDGSIVFVPAGEGEYQLREVEIGTRTPAWVEITRGLAAGERVVTTGSFQLKSEARRESFGGHEH